MHDSYLLQDLITVKANLSPGSTALTYGKTHLTYGELQDAVLSFANGLLNLGLSRGERVAIYLEKRFETVIASFGAPTAGGVFVPLNPLLKPDQVGYIMRDCNVRVLVTSPERLALLKETLSTCHDLRHIVVLDSAESIPNFESQNICSWSKLLSAPLTIGHRVIDTDVVGILYTSGSTGKPKGVVLSHRNLVAGAKSVTQYLKNRPDDRVLTVLPLSFDYGLSQLTTTFYVGAANVLMNYLLPRDIIRTVNEEQITGLAAVPPLWIQLAQLDWRKVSSLRYITNSGGAMPRTTLDRLRSALPDTKVFLMYGFTEAFRSTYLAPEEIDRHPDSMGKAIPNAEVLVLREDGSHCTPGEPGELVHRGVLVAMGYWNDVEKTALCFKPIKASQAGLPIAEFAAWSGDTVRMDDEGFLYFIERRDEMIKTSGYRVSPTEVEEVIYATECVAEAAAIGVPHPVLGQAIVVIITARKDIKPDVNTLLMTCKQQLPAYMLPHHIDVREGSLPRNPNGKIDRKALFQEMQYLFTENDQ